MKQLESTDTNRENDGHQATNSAPPDNTTNQAGQKPQEPAKTANGDKKNEPQPQPARPDVTNKRIEQNSPDSKAAPQNSLGCGGFRGARGQRLRYLEGILCQAKTAR